MATRHTTEHVDTLVIGGGHSGLSTGYHLKRQGLSFRILDANARIGDQWRQRWDSLRLFTPARFDGLAGMPFPASPRTFPTKDEMADYLEAYATRFDLPVETNTRVDRLFREQGRFIARCGDRRIEADQVVVAMAYYQEPKVLSFADQLDPEIVRFHSKEYRNPGQLRDGPVLLVGAGNSGSELAMELAATHEVWMSGRDTGHLPFRIDSPLAHRLLIRLVLRGLFHRVFTVSNPVGRKMRGKVLETGGPLIRVQPKDLAARGVKRVAKTAGIEHGRPMLEDGTILDVANVIWCTGFDHSFPWIDLPGMDAHGPKHERGIVPECPGLYFVGLHFLYSLSSGMVHGVDRDAQRIVKAVAARAREQVREAESEPSLAATAD